MKVHCIISPKLAIPLESSLPGPERVPGKKKTWPPRLRGLKSFVVPEQLHSLSPFSFFSLLFSTVAWALGNKCTLRASPDRWNSRSSESLMQLAPCTGDSEATIPLWGPFHWSLFDSGLRCLLGCIGSPLPCSKCTGITLHDEGNGLSL